MNTLCIDFGNTQVKAAIFRNNQQAVFESRANTDISFIIKMASSEKMDAAIVSSVSISSRALEIQLQSIIKNVVNFTHHTPVPVENLYKTPESLGKDRLAAAVGGNFLYPNTNLLIIDAGTAITYELINARGQYLGGNISPGLQTRFAALSHFTQRLPLLSPAESIPAFGTNSTEAIRVGVQQGLVLEVDGSIATYKAMFPDLKVLVTGGDTAFFDNKLKSTIFACPNLVMVGLNRILTYGSETN